MNKYIKKKKHTLECLNFDLMLENLLAKENKEK